MERVARNRRHWMQSTLLGAACSLLAPGFSLGSRKPRTFNLGVASYSLRKLSRAQAIAAVKALRTPFINIKSFHIPYETSLAERRAARKEFEDGGLKIVGGGVIPMQEDSDAAVQRYFDYARDCGMPLMAIAPSARVMPRVEKFVKQYDIKVAIHNHGPEDEHFPAPADALKVIRGMDPRVGLCVDVGHTARTGTDVVQAVSAAGSRLLDMHMKDLRDLSDSESQCAIGEGVIPVPAVFRTLLDIGYSGYVNLEYEIEPEDPLAGMQRSFAYMRGVLDGMDPSLPSTR